MGIKYDPRLYEMQNGNFHRKNEKKTKNEQTNKQTK